MLIRTLLAENRKNFLISWLDYVLKIHMCTQQTHVYIDRNLIR